MSVTDRFKMYVCPWVAVERQLGCMERFAMLEPCTGKPDSRMEALESVLSVARTGSESRVSMEQEEAKGILGFEEPCKRCRVVNGASCFGRGPRRRIGH